jgi:DNA-binding MarR family transcriptional regulator
MGKKARAREKERERRKLPDDVAPGPQALPADLEQLATRLNSVAVHLLRRLSREDATVDLTPARLSALTLLVARGPLTLGALARSERVTAPSMTRLATAMERDGLLERIPSAQDGRKVYVRATDAGATLMRAGQERRVAALTSWLAPVGADGLRCLDDASVLLETVFRDESS